MTQDFSDRLRKRVDYSLATFDNPQLFNRIETSAADNDCFAVRGDGHCFIQIPICDAFITKLADCSLYSIGNGILLSDLFAARQRLGRRQSRADLSPPWSGRPDSIGVPSSDHSPGCTAILSGWIMSLGGAAARVRPSRASRTA